MKYLRIYIAALPGAVLSQLEIPTGILLGVPRRKGTCWKGSTTAWEAKRRRFSLAELWDSCRTWHVYSTDPRAPWAALDMQQLYANSSRVWRLANLGIMFINSYFKLINFWDKFLPLLLEKVNTQFQFTRMYRLLITEIWNLACSDMPNHFSFRVLAAPIPWLISQ